MSAPIASPNEGRIITGCGVGIDAFRIAEGAPGERAALHHDLGPHTEEPRIPQHEVGELAHLHRSDVGGDAVGDRGVDRVLAT